MTQAGRRARVGFVCFPFQLETIPFSVVGPPLDPSLNWVPNFCIQPKPAGLRLRVGGSMPTLQHVPGPAPRQLRSFETNFSGFSCGLNGRIWDASRVSAQNRRMDSRGTNCLSNWWRKKKKKQTRKWVVNLRDQKLREEQRTSATCVEPDAAELRSTTSWASWVQTIQANTEAAMEKRQTVSFEDSPVFPCWG